ncbi:MAG: Smr/MutS family protein [Acidobacteriota bacterium]
MAGKRKDRPQDAPGEASCVDRAPTAGHDPFELPIDGVLDLHTFSPKDVKDLVPEYIGECLRRGIVEIRIIHGKGTGTLKATVHSILKKDPRVAGFEDADMGAGGWGATVVRLAEP